MKFKPEEFKAMLKECILELYQEGKIGNGAGVFPQSHHPTLNTNEEEPTLNPFTEVAKTTAAQLSKGNSKTRTLYENIFADTAKNARLMSQVRGNGASMDQGFLGGSPATAQERVQDQAQLKAIPGSDRWAQIALGNKTR